MKNKLVLLCPLLLCLFLHCRKETPIEEPTGGNPCRNSLTTYTGIPTPVSGWTIEEKNINPQLSNSAKPYFLNEQQGFLLTTNGVVWKTADGGQSWKEVFQKYTYLELQMDFIDEKQGFLTAGGNFFELYKTTDGGDTWERQESAQAGSLYRIDFRNALEAVAAATTPANSAQPDSMHICRTSDGGLTWQILSQTDLSYFSQNGLQMLNDSLGFFGGKEGRLYRTLDGGNTVASVKTNLKELYYFQFLDSLTGYASDYTRLYKTSDGGSSWQAIQSLPILLFHFSSPTEGLVMSYLDQCVDFDIVTFAIGFLTTSDGGNTFQSSPASLNFNLWKWHFPTPTLGYSVWNNKLVKFTKQ
ncbi:MAG: hypothetical protein IT260_03025 [Saprospiraceae bacterium]|nr:hypothetical protein [Saprospiraceae bacterium]